MTLQGARPVQAGKQGPPGQSHSSPRPWEPGVSRSLGLGRGELSLQSWFSLLLGSQGLGSPHLWTSGLGVKGLNFWTLPSKRIWTSRPMELSLYDPAPWDYWMSGVWAFGPLSLGSRGL